MKPASDAHASVSARPTVLHAAGFDALYGGNFIASLEALETACAGLGLGVAFAFPASADRTVWYDRMIREGRRVHLLSARATAAADAITLARLAQIENAAIIHTHFNRYDMAAIAAGVLLRLRRKTVSVVWHAHSPFRPAARLPRALKNFIKFKLLGRRAFTVAVSEHIRGERIGAGCAPFHVRTIPNGVDLARASAALRPRDEILDELRIRADHHLLLLFGWEPERKGVDLAFDAIGPMAAAGLPVVLGVVGTEDLGAFVSSRCGASTPPWLRIIPPADDVASLYRAASIFVSASRHEGLPYSVFEAMASGLPVVISDIPGTSWAREAPGCVLFGTEDAASLAAAIREVLGWSPEERSNRIAAETSFVRAKYSISAWAAQVAELYRELLSITQSL